VAITIDYTTLVIQVPKADLTLVDAGPPEIRQLDLDSFRLELKAIEDNEAHMPFADTHEYTPPSTLGGVTYSRVVEVVNGYTVQFEDAQYTVNVVGGNSNLSDVKVQNQVSVNTANSAGLIETGVSGLTTEESNLLTSIGSRLPSALVSGKMDSTLSSAERDLVAAALLDLANGVEAGHTVRQAMRLILAVIAGKSSGHPTNPVYRDCNDSMDRLIATLDEDGNRTSVTRNSS
jgi:hypothetical protein